MANGKPGDHPITDVIAHGLPAFDPAIDSLIVSIANLGGWKSQIAAKYMLDEQTRLQRLLQEGDEEGRRNLLRNLKRLLETELMVLRDGA